MNPSSIRFRCPKCAARIKAPRQLIGESRDCPGCGRAFVVPRPIPEDLGPVLVLVEGAERCTLGVAYRRSA
ncbi:MAG TPA: hypothetical protein VKA46_41605 [Gemmataceae bacterium]|nr:hypothetical protein [Gemmataceae bacterium]